MRAILIGSALLASTLSAHAETAEGFKRERFAELRFDLPARWERVASAPSEEFQMGIWRAGASELAITRWPGVPPRDGGAMVVARRWPIVVAGQKTELLQTTYFQNVQAQVLVCFWKHGEVQFRVHARRASQREVSAILRSIGFEEAG